MKIKPFMRKGVFLLCGGFLLIASIAGAAGSAAVTVETTLGSIGTGAELILCPLLGKKIRDANWLYRTLPDGTANPAYPPAAPAPYASPVPPAPAVTDLSQNWSSWNVAQNVVVDSTDKVVPMEKILFEPVPVASAAVAAATGSVVIYVDSTDPCPQQDAYRAYLRSKGIPYTQLERRQTPNYNQLVGSLNYLSPGNVFVPLLLIKGEPVVGKWRASTQARIDLLLKKHGLVP